MTPEERYILEKQHSYKESMKAAEWSYTAVAILFLIGMLLSMLNAYI